VVTGSTGLQLYSATPSWRWQRTGRHPSGFSISLVALEPSLMAQQRDDPILSVVINKLEINSDTTDGANFLYTTANNSGPNYPGRKECYAVEFSLLH